MGSLRAHQDPDLVEALPIAVEGEQGADFEVSGRDVERLRDAGPLLQIPKPGPAGDTVVDDEELAALGVNLHDAPVRTSSRGAGGRVLGSPFNLLPTWGNRRAKGRRFVPVTLAQPPTQTSTYESLKCSMHPTSRAATLYPAVDRVLACIEMRGHIVDPQSAFFRARSVAPSAALRTTVDHFR